MTKSMCSMVALENDTFAKLFLIVYIEPGCKDCCKALHWQVKRPSDIAAACPKRFGLKIIRLDIVYIGT